MAHALPAPRIRPLGWALIVFRLLLMILMLVLCAPLHLLWKLVGAGRWWPRVFLAAIGMIAGLHIRIEGQPRRGALLLANHVSWLDIPALAHATGSAFVAHDGLTAFPVLKWLCEMNETVFIARHSRTSIADQVEQVRLAMDSRGSLTLFPEGTTSDGTGLLPFKSSLLSALVPLPAGVAVQPVLLAYEDAARIAWVGEEHGLDNFKRILARLRPIRLTMVFLEPLSGEALTDRKTISATARSEIASAMAR
ncbi:2-acyl-glycerophospho-ethanolamine acyltransferase [Tsuneonella dongtanensis]|uniref:2-acyl-glycerophospho-ethanolamine acyltransferase n=1 Tax=Tsuneonella dongtanensis TaxID=692370 RepID=A0A1B2AE84_9SPHN|nr:lysophospholipid acyltransferase family protein [Tsuneonella dongtanensis]ANY20355.1 2-acyl-glycerophospho-ethanolamine acyltransferase [Tsuneonella dongtanensis]